MEIPAGSQGKLRQQNERRILDYVREHGGATQAEIAEADEVGLTRAAVAKLIGAAERDGSNGSTGEGRLHSALERDTGRPARYSIRSDLAYVISLDLGRYHVRVLAEDLAGAELLDGDEFSTRPGDTINAREDPHGALRTAADFVNRARNELEGRYGRDGLAGLVIGVPFPVAKPSGSNGEMIKPKDVPAWDLVQLPTALWDQLGWSTDSYAIESVVNLGALAELDAIKEADVGPGFEKKSANLLYVRWSTTIDGAIVSDGRLHRGFRGLAGEFAHGVDPENNNLRDDACEHCSSYCANAVASLKAFESSPLLAKAGIDFKELENNSDRGRSASERRLSALVKMARAGGANHPAEILLQQAGRCIGRALGTAANTLNPQVVVLGGAFHRDEYLHVQSSVEAGLKETAWPPVLTGLTIRPGERTGRAAVVGGLSLALDQFASSHLLSRLPTLEPARGSQPPRRKARRATARA